MRFHSSASLMTRLVVLILVASGPVIVLLIASATEFRSYMTDGLIADARIAARIAAHDQERWIGEARQLLTIASRLPDVRRGDATACGAALAELQSGLPQYALLGVLAVDGSLGCSAIPTPNPPWAGDRPYFQRALQTHAFALGDYQVGRITGTPTLTAALPVLNEDGQVLGVIFAGLDVAWLNQRSAEIRLPQDATLTLTDQSGVIVAHYPSPEAWVGRPSPLAELLPFEAHDAVDRVATWTGPDGTQYLIVARPLSAELGGSVIVGIPTASLYAQVDRMLARNLAALAVVVALVIGATWVAGRAFIVHPVRRLLRAMQQLASGDLNARAQLAPGAGELSQLGHAFDETVALLADRQRALEEQAALLDLAQDAIIVCDMEHTVHFWNPGAERMYGWSRDEAVGQALDDLLKTKLPEPGLDVNAQLAERDHWEGELVQKRRDRARAVVASRWSLQRDAEGQPFRILIINSDITDRKALAEQLTRQALFDTDTGLPNRALLLDRIQRALSRSQRHRRGLAVIFLNLDRFARVNESLGHAFGDTLLAAVAERLQACLRRSDTVARFGGDEFVAVTEGLHDPGEAEAAADRLIEAVGRPFVIDDREVFLTAAAGITLRLPSRVDDTPEDLLREANTALHRAKAAGPASQVVFDDGMHERIEQRIDLEADLHRALAHDELRLHYQPIVDLKSGAMVEVEALLRWDHPTRGLVMPGDFIPLAEETGLIVPIGRWVLHEACEQAQRWRALNPEGAAPVVGINLSAREFQQADLVDHVAAVLRETGLDPACLRLEITESLLMDDAPGTERGLRALRELGVRLAIDDFGTGYASLSYLQRFAVDTLKIDRIFVLGLDHNAEAEVIVRAVIALAHALNLEVTAEGIETAAHLERLRALGCDRGQGYFLGWPGPAQALERVFTTGRLDRGEHRFTA